MKDGENYSRQSGLRLLGNFIDETTRKHPHSSSLYLLCVIDQMCCYLNGSKIAADSAVFGQICPPLTSWDCIWVPTSKSPTRRKISLTLLVIMLQKREAVGQKPIGGVCTGITEYVTVSTRAGV